MQCLTCFSIFLFRFLSFFYELWMRQISQPKNFHFNASLFQFYCQIGLANLQIGLFNSFSYWLIDRLIELRQKNPFLVWCLARTSVLPGIDHWFTVTKAIIKLWLGGFGHFRFLLSIFCLTKFCRTFGWFSLCVTVVSWCHHSYFVFAALVLVDSWAWKSNMPQEMHSDAEAMITMPRYLSMLAAYNAPVPVHCFRLLTKKWDILNITSSNNRWILLCWPEESPNTDPVSNSTNYYTACVFRG